MNKSAILLCAAIFGLIGAYVPVLLRIDDGLGPWSVLGGLIGGLFGVWVAVKIGKRF